MMRKLAIRVLQPLRWVVTSFTYNHAVQDLLTARHAQLLQQIASLQERLDAMPLVSLHQKVDGLKQVVEKILISTQEGGDLNPASEISRLDGYIVYHFDALRTDLQQSVRTLHAALDKMYVISLHEKIDALRTAVATIPDSPDRVVDRIGALLIEELDRLDGSILHHVAGLRAALRASRSADEAPVDPATLETEPKTEAV